jgi:predicted membrane channel-forming protein YqfA (hemolysin III family)
MDPSGAQAVVASSVELVRPRWRGRLHLAAFAASVPAGVALCALAGSSSARAAAALYALTVSGVFGVSAAFHLVTWSPAEARAAVWLSERVHVSGWPACASDPRAPLTRVRLWRLCASGRR